MRSSMSLPRRAIGRCSRRTRTSIASISRRETGSSASRGGGRSGRPCARSGWPLRAGRYDLGIDVRGDILSVCVLALAGVKRRLGWTMGGGGFLLTDVAEWVPGRHEVRSRLALLDRLEIGGDPTARIAVPTSDSDRVRVAQRLGTAWPERGASPHVTAKAGRSSRSSVATALAGPAPRSRVAWDEPDWLHAGRFGEESPLLAVHLGAGTSAKRWPVGHWQDLIRKFLADGWRIILVGGVDDVDVAARIAPHGRLRDWTGQLRLTETAALARASRLLHRLRLGPGARGGLDGNSLAHPVQRDQPATAVAALVTKDDDPPEPRRVPALPPEGLPVGGSSVHGGDVARPGLPRGPAVVEASASSGVAACRRSDEGQTTGPDWRGWLALAWMVAFGFLYAVMILREKAPGLIARISGGGEKGWVRVGGPALTDRDRRPAPGYETNPIRPAT